MSDLYMSAAEFAELDRLLAKCGADTLRAWVATRINGASSSMVLCGNESMTLTKLFDQLRDARAAQAAQPLPVPADEGPKCRDCADFGPICPNSGLPCGEAATQPGGEVAK